MKIALAGNPNSGKTTMFNALTGRSEKIGNWAGVTVDRKEYKIKHEYLESSEEVIAVDLPGAYSMSPFTSEESVTATYIKNEKPDVIINIVDASNLSRSLFFTTQLLELGIPMVVALNKSDINSKHGTHIDIVRLAERLSCPVLETVSIDSEGIKEVVKASLQVVGNIQKAAYVDKEVDITNKKAVEEADKRRFEFVNELVSEVETRKILTREKNSSDKIDEVLTNPIAGIIVFAAVMFLVFFISQSTLGDWIANILSAIISVFKDWVGNLMQGANPVLYALLVDGIIGGVGAVVGFLPLIMIMYFLIALLEDCGYMARATVVLDPIFKKVGLSGKSAIPMIMGTGCGVPAIMGCRTIKNERERRTTAMLATFMPCGAKLPLIALFTGAFFPKSMWIGPLMYFVGILLILLGALIIRGITGMQYKKSYFIIELPDYKLPSLKFAALSMLERGKAYIIKAGTVILVCNTVIQIMQSFDTHLKVVGEGLENTSILAKIAGPIAILLVPIIGVVSWQCAAAAVTGLIAKENVVGTIATCYAITSFINVEELELAGSGSEVATIMGITKAAALAFMMFNLFSPPCVAALGALNAELHSWKWMVGAVEFQLATGFTVGFLVYQIGTLITEGTFGAGFIGGLIAVACFATVIIYLIAKADKDTKVTYEIQ